MFAKIKPALAMVGLPCALISSAATTKKKSTGMEHVSMNM
jgi:hypothetical protein